MATTNTSKAAGILLLAVILPLSTVAASRTGPPTHHSHGSNNKHRPSPPPPPPAAPAPAPSSSSTAAPLVRATCNATTYYDLCVSTLGADPSSATADVRGLSTIAVSAAAANASGGAAAATALLATGANNATAQAPSSGAGADAAVQALLRTCATKYGQARDALDAARGSIAQQDYDSASVQLGAATEYPQVCRVLFQRQRPDAYPPEPGAGGQRGGASAALHRRA